MFTSIFFTFSLAFFLCPRSALASQGGFPLKKVKEHPSLVSQAAALSQQAALVQAVEKSDYQRVSNYLKQYPQLANTLNKDYLSLLCIATQKSDMRMIRLLLENKASVQLPPLLYVQGGGRHLVSPLHITSKNNNPALAQFLIDCKAHVNHREHNGLNTPLHYASIQMIPLLVRHGASLEAKNCYGYTPLHLAVEHNEVNRVQCLLDCKSDINTQDHMYATPLNDWTVVKNPALVQMLIDGKANVNTKDRPGFTPLYKACHGKSVAVIKMLVHAGAQIVPELAPEMAQLLEQDKITNKLAQLKL